MKLKDYSICSSSTDLVLCCFQNAMISFMEDQKLTQSLEDGHYLYHGTYRQAISDKAMPNQIYHAYMEFERYCQEHQDCEGELSHILYHELLGAIHVHGERIHEIERLKHGRDITEINN